MLWNFSTLDFFLGLGELFEEVENFGEGDDHSILFHGMLSIG